MAAATLLSACGDASGSGGAAAGSTTTPSTTAAPTTPASTVTVTVTATSSLPVPTLTKPGKPNTTMSTPPPAKDPLVIPGNPKAYGQAFVTAWVDRNKANLQTLGTSDAVRSISTATPTKAPTFTRCEGAAGSSYCTWQGDEYTLTVRVLNEKSSLRQEQAVTEAKFAH